MGLGCRGVFTQVFAPSQVPAGANYPFYLTEPRSCRNKEGCVDGSPATLSPITQMSPPIPAEMQTWPIKPSLSRVIPLTAGQDVPSPSAGPPGAPAGGRGPSPPPALLNPFPRGGGGAAGRDGDVPPVPGGVPPASQREPARLQLPQCQQQGWVRSSLWTFPHKHTSEFPAGAAGRAGKAPPEQVLCLWPEPHNVLLR